MRNLQTSGSSIDNAAKLTTANDIPEIVFKFCDEIHFLVLLRPTNCVAADNHNVLETMSIRLVLRLWQLLVNILGNANGHYIPETMSSTFRIIFPSIHFGKNGKQAIFRNLWFRVFVGSQPIPVHLPLTLLPLPIESCSIWRSQMWWNSSMDLNELIKLLFGRLQE